MLTPCSITTTQSPGTLNYRHCCSCCCTRHTAHTTAACVAVHKPTDLPKIQTITRPLRSPDESTAGHKNAAIHHRGQVPVSVYRDGEYTCGPLPPHHDTTPRVTRHSVRHYPGPRGFTTPPPPKIRLKPWSDRYHTNGPSAGAIMLFQVTKNTVTNQNNTALPANKHLKFHSIHPNDCKTRRGHIMPSSA